jgi:hypothetical protein
MKKIIIALALITVGTGAFAQGAAGNEVFRQVCRR